MRTMWQCSIDNQRIAVMPRCSQAGSRCHDCRCSKLVIEKTEKSNIYASRKLNIALGPGACT